MPVRKTGALPEPIDRQVNEIIRAVNVIEEQIAKLSQGLRGQVDAAEGLSNQAYSLSVDLEMLNAKTSTMEGIVEMLNAKTSTMEGIVEMLNAKTSTMEGIVAAQGDEIRAILPITRDKLVDDVLSGLIVESGSNANGEYVRWGNGFQVCWRYFNWPQSGGTRWWNSIYNWTYPVMFKERPNVHVVHGYGGSPHEIGYFNSGLRTITTTTAELVLVELGDYGESTISGYVEAKGWWK